MQAVLVGEHHIEQHRVPLLLIHQVTPGGGIDRYVNVVALFFKQRSQDVRDDRLVIDDKDARLAERRQLQQIFATHAVA
jgi:hypothetical protein